MEHRAHNPRTRADRFFARKILGDAPLRTAFWGSLGRKRVAEHLDQLGAQWSAFHELLLPGGARIAEHVVIGPAGVFVIESMPAHGLSVWVGGRSIRVSRNGRAGQGKEIRFLIQEVEERALGVAQALSARSDEPIECRGILNIIDADRIAVGMAPLDVDIVDGSDLVAWLQRRPEELEAADVALLSEIAARADVWEDDSAFRLEPAETIDAYAAILSEHNHLQEIKRRWKRARRVVGWLIFLGLSLGAVAYMLSLAEATNG